MNFIIAFMIKKIGVTSVLTLIESLYVASLFAFFIFIIQAISFVRTQVQVLLNNMSGSGIGGGSVDISHMLGYLNAIGFFDAFNTAEPFLESAVSFLLMRFLWKFTLNAYKEFVLSIYHVADTL